MTYLRPTVYGNSDWWLSFEKVSCFPSVSHFKQKWVTLGKWLTFENKPLSEEKAVSGPNGLLLENGLSLCFIIKVLLIPMWRGLIFSERLTFKTCHFSKVSHLGSKRHTFGILLTLKIKPFSKSKPFGINTRKGLAMGMGPFLGLFSFLHDMNSLVPSPQLFTNYIGMWHSCAIV